MGNLVKVTAAKDNDGHWYVFPAECGPEFWENLENEEMADSGEFDDKWGKYRTGGDLNLIQLWAQDRAEAPLAIDVLPADVHAAGPRRSGKTVRLIDYYVQELFKHGKAEIRDHARHDGPPNRWQNEDLMEQVMHRMRSLQNWPNDSLRADKKTCTITAVKEGDKAAPAGSTPVTFGFEMAMTLMKKGERITRREWGSRWLTMDGLGSPLVDGRIIEAYSTENSAGEQCWTPKLEDLMAQDWILLSKPTETHA